MKKISFSKLALLVFFAVVLIGSVILAVVGRNADDTPFVPEQQTDTMTLPEITTAPPEETTAPLTEGEEITTPSSLMTYVFYTYTDDQTDMWEDEEQEEDEDTEEEHTGMDEDPYTEAVAKAPDVINHRDRSYFSTESSYIDMENISQLPELPTGCEITALTILLRHYGFDAEKTDLARNYLPKSWGNARYVDGVTYKDSFFDYFIGDPFSNGYGCFSGAIETAAEEYIASHGGGFTVRNISGCSPDTLYEYVADGLPVLCWATDGMIAPEYYETWYDNDTGERLDWYLNEHCFVLAGYDVNEGTVTLNDPMKGIITYSIDKFETRFEQMYSQAILIRPESISQPVWEDEETETEPETTAPPETEQTKKKKKKTETAAETAAPAEPVETMVNIFTEDFFDDVPELTTQGTTFDNDFPVFEDIN